jgi:methylmalonyl-CoA mutase
MSELTEKPILSLAEGFDTVTKTEWIEMVEKGLKGRTIDDISNNLTYEGVALNPIYTSSDIEELTGKNSYQNIMSEVRNRLNGNPKANGWEVRQTYFRSDPGAINEDIKSDIAGGVNSLLLKVTHDTNSLDNSAAIISSITDLDTLLDGIDCETNSISFLSDMSVVVVASMFTALMQKREIDLHKVSGSCGGDPIGMLARLGVLQGNIDEHFKKISELAAWNIQNMPRMRAFDVDTTTYHGAGVTETEDLAIAMSTAVNYLRAMVSNGLSLDEAFGQISFTTSVGMDVFQGIAKLRAARFLWSRISEVCGVKKNIGSMVLNAMAASRTLSKRDAAVNMLRSTSACFSAGTGGADTVTLFPHTNLWGVESQTARRIIRNTQNILINESSLGRVVDPSGGSHYVEYLTKEFAERSWQIFQDLESKGGVLQELLAGGIQKIAEQSWKNRKINLDNRNEPLTGVSSFPDLNEIIDAQGDMETPKVDRQFNSIATNNINLLGHDFASLIKAAGEGGSAHKLFEIFSKTKTVCDPLKQHRLGEAYEILRDQSDRWLTLKGSRPLALLTCLGTQSDYTARANFSRNYLAAGGIESLELALDSLKLKEAINQSNCDLVVICSSDKVYSEVLEATVEVLQSCEAGMIILAGDPGAKEKVLKELGVDLFIHADDNMLEALSKIAKRIGMG